jgi:hypothetical protein
MSRQFHPEESWKTKQIKKTETCMSFTGLNLKMRNNLRRVQTYLMSVIALFDSRKTASCFCVLQPCKAATYGCPSVPLCMGHLPSLEVPSLVLCVAACKVNLYKSIWRYPPRCVYRITQTTLCIPFDTTCVCYYFFQTSNVSIKPMFNRCLFCTKTQGTNVNFCDISQMISNMKYK